MIPQECRNLVSPGSTLTSHRRSRLVPGSSAHVPTGRWGTQAQGQWACRSRAAFDWSPLRQGPRSRPQKGRKRKLEAVSRSLSLFLYHSVSKDKRYRLHENGKPLLC